MGEGSNIPSDDEEGDEGEHSDDGEDEEGSADNHASPTKGPGSASPSTSSLPTMKSIPDIDGGDTTMVGAEVNRSNKSVTTHESTDGKSGSPLKNIALTTSTLNSPLASPNAPTSPPQTSEVVSTVSQTTEKEETESTPPTVPLSPVLPPPEPIVKEESQALETAPKEDEGDEMLLDAVDGTNKPTDTTDPVPAPDPETEKAHTPPAAPDALPAETDVPAATKPEVTPQPQIDDAAPQESSTKEGNPPPEAEDDDDDFPDLLGGLEKSLEKQSSV
jgi:hypothetical protein